MEGGDAAPMTPQFAIVERARYFHGLVVREVGSNKGPWVEAIVRLGGAAKAGNAWCARFVAAVMAEAERVHGVELVGFRRSGAARSYWQHAPDGSLIWPSNWRAARPGDVFVRTRLSRPLTDAGLLREGVRVQGHTGIVVEVDEGGVTCISGNSSGTGHSKVAGSGAVAYERMEPGSEAWQRLAGFSRFWGPVGEAVV